MARFLRTETNSSGGHSQLRNHLVAPAEPGLPLARPIKVKIAGLTDRKAHIVQQRAPRSTLNPPAVVGAGIAYGGPGTRLTEPQSANDQNRRRKAKPFLRAPVVVFAPEPVVYEPIAGYLTKPRDTAPRVRSSLRQYVVTTTPAPFVAKPIDVNLAPSTKLGRRASPKLSKPTVVTAAATQIFYGPKVKIDRSFRGRGVAKSVLHPPTVVDTVRAQIRGYLTKPRDTAPRTISRLRRGPETAYQCPVTRSVGRRFLSPPAALYSGDPEPSSIATTYASDSFARSTINGWGTADVGGTWSNTGSRFSTNGTRAEWTMTAGTTGGEATILSTPITASFEAAFQWTFNEAWATNINRIEFGWGLYLLRLENGTNDRVQMTFLDGTATAVSGTTVPWPDNNPDYGNLWWAKVRVEGGVLYAKAWKDGSAEPDWQIVALAPATPTAVGAAFAFSHFSTVTNTMVVDSFSMVSLTGCASGSGPQLPPPVRDRSPAVHSLLRPPTVVTVSGVFYGPKVELARSFRGRPKSRLLPVPPAFRPFRPAITHLAYAPTRARAKSRLSAPAVVGPILASPISVTLAPQKRGRPDYILRAPVVVGLVLARDIATSLVPQRRGVPKSRLFAPTVVAPVLAAPIHTSLSRIRPVATVYQVGAPVVITPATPGYVATHLAYSKRGRPKSQLFPPTAVAPFLAAPIHTVFTRIRPVRTNFFLRRPADLVDRDDLGYLRTHLAYSRRGVPKSRLEPPTVVAPVLARPTKVALIRIRPRPTYPTLRRPTDLVDKQDLGFVVTHLAYSKRGRPKSRLSPPAVVAPVLARAIQAHLVRIRPVAIHSVVRRPVDLVDRDDLGYLRVHLTYSRRGVPKSRLFAPAVVAPVLASPIHRTLIRIRPVRATYVLRRPVDLVDRDDLGYVRVHLAYSTRGAPKSRLSTPAVVNVVVFIARPITVQLARIRPQKTHSQVAPPFVIDAAEGPQGGIGIWLAPSFRGTPKSKLRPPAVISSRVEVSTITVSLAYSSRGVPKSGLAHPAVINAAPRAKGRTATQFTQPPRIPIHSRLSPPAVVTAAAQAYYGPTVTLAPSRAGRAKPRLLPVPSAFQPFRQAIIHLAYSKRGKAKPTLSEPAVVAPVLARAIDTTLAPQRRGIPKSRLLLVPAAFRPVGILKVRLAPSKRGTPKSKLSAPTVVGLVLARAIRVTLAPQKRGIPKSALRPPVIPPVAPPIDEEIAVKITLASLPLRRVHSRLSPPAVVAPVLARATETTLVRIRPPRTEYVLRRPIDLVDREDLGYVRAHLAYSLRGVPKSHLEPPAVVAPVLARAIDTTFVRGGRGTPKSRLFLPTAVFAFVGPPVRVALVRIRPAATSYQIGAPVVVIPDQRTYLVLSVVLAPSSRGIPKSRLSRPVVIDVRPQTSYLSITLAPSFRGRPKSGLGFPISILDNGVLGSTMVSLAPSRRGTPKSKLQSPVVVAPVLARAIDVTLAPQKRGTPKSVLRKPIIPPVAPPIDEEIAVKITLASLPLRRVHSRLSPPAVVGPVLARPTKVSLARIRPSRTLYEIKPPTLIDVRPQTYFLSVNLAYSLRGAPKSQLLPPPEIQDIAKAETVLAVTLAYSLRGKPKSKLKPPTVVTAATAYLRAIDVTLAPQRRGLPKSHLGNYIVPAFSPAPIFVALAPSSRGVAKPFLREVVYGAKSYAPISVTLAPQRRGVPKSLLRKVIYDAKTYAPITVTLAPQRRGVPKSKLPTVIYAARSFAPISITFAPQSRGVAKPRLEQVVYAARVYAPIRVELAFSGRGVAKSFLHQTIFEARVYAPVKVILAASPRVDRTPHSRLNTPTVGQFVARPVTVTFAPQRKSKTVSFLTRPTPAGRVYAAIRVWLAPAPRIDRAPHSRLAAPTVVTPFLATPISVTFARTPRIPTIQFRREPILATPGFPGSTVTLARIRPPRTVARIFPPAVVNPYVPPIATFLSVNLAYSVRGRPIHHLGFVPGLSHGGIVCGVILDLTEVCQDITADADTIIPGGVLETHVVNEETTASTVIMGETLAETRVDQEIE